MEGVGRTIGIIYYKSLFWHSRNDNVLGRRGERRGYHVETFGIQTEVTLDPNVHSFE